MRVRMGAPDVVERAVVEKAVTAELRAELLEGLPDPVLLIDDEARLTWANPAAAALFGKSVAESIGLSGFDFVHPDDLQLVLVSIASMQHKDVGSLLEVRIRSTEGWRLTEVLGARLDAGLLIVMRDVTERRRWEVAGDETARFRSLLQNGTSLTMLLGADGRVGTSSVGLTRLLGLDQEEVEGHSFADLVRDQDHVAFAAAWSELCAPQPASHPEPARVTVDLHLRRATGETVPFAITFNNLLDDPTVAGIVAVGHDVSDRVRTEEELRASNSLLAATLESTADGILVVDRDGRITSFNRRFGDMWRLPPASVDTLDDQLLMTLVMEQLCDPTAFVAKVQELYADLEAESHDVLEFLDGRVFERDSMPQRIDGEVVGRVWSFRDMTDERRLQAELAHQAFHDPLTGLANQALFRDRVAVATARLARHGGQLAVVFIDLDDFKTVNDSLGHSAGDTLLVHVSERITSCLRAGDTAARLGGDEFAVLIDELSSPEEAVGVVERILAVLREPVPLSATWVSTAASIGIAYGTSSVQVDDLLRNADLAMYTAKAAGKNTHRTFAAEMHEAALERLDLETHLRGAADRGELVVHYQPILELDTGRIVSMEALVRWAHPERGLLAPGSFIPFAEEGGLIEEIGAHVLVAACERARHWVQLVGERAAPGVSVNLSPRQLGDRQLPDRVDVLLHRSGIDPSQLVLEITEGALMKDPAAATESLRRLSRLGVRLAVDDFGTGYSSLAYLRQFPLDLLKIDGSFVDDAMGSGWSLAQAIVQIAHALGLEPIAEGVETAAQAEALAGFGCNLAQGFHLGRPVDAATADALVLESVTASSRPGPAVAAAPGTRRWGR
jgi:diguanylate cyclase (GGDEF)-like protein/PAS domain S-box-containing protein